MKSLPLFLFMIALALYSLQAQDIVVYAHNEKPYKSTIKTFNEKEETSRIKLLKGKHDEISWHATPVGNFLNISHKLPKKLLISSLR